MNLLCLRIINIQNQKIESKFSFHEGKTTFMLTDITTCFVVLGSVASVQKKNNVYIAAYSKKN